MTTDPWATYLRRFNEFWIRIAKRFDQDHCMGIAASLSFTSLLALVPLFTVMFSVIALFPVSEKWALSIEEFLFANFVPAAGDTVRQYLVEFSSQAGRLTAVGLGFLLVSSLSLLATIEESFNQIWRVKEGRRWTQRLLIYWAMLTLGPILIVTSLSMSSALLSMPFWSEQALVATFTQTMLRYLPVILEAIAFLLFYQAVPNCEVSLKHSVIGAIVATILFEITKYGFAVWILNFNSYQLIYGALATVPIFFIWVYLCWSVMLIGALVTATLGSMSTDSPSTSLAKETG